MRSRSFCQWSIESEAFKVFTARESTRLASMARHRTRWRSIDSGDASHRRHARIEAARSIADQALASLKKVLLELPTEREFGLELDFAMRRLGAQNLAEQDPSKIIQWLFYSHPPLRERIAAAQAFRT